MSGFKAQNMLVNGLVVGLRNLGHVPIGVVHTGVNQARVPKEDGMDTENQVRVTREAKVHGMDGVNQERGATVDQERAT